MRPSIERLLPWLRWWPYGVVTALAAWLLWPVPAGQMPLSADHTVHLTRIWMYAQTLADGAPRAWSSIWFFGTPVGELYPVLGDLLVIAIRWLGLGLPSWSTAYALGFFVVFASQGWAVLRTGRAMGWGVWPGLVAAVLVLMDAGAYREGGWIYTVTYGVWPQAFSTALTWLGLGELVRAMQVEDARAARRPLVWASSAMAAALLAHPMSLPTIAVAVPLALVILGVRGRAPLARVTATAILAGGLGLALAAWWLLPMLSHRAWMASYGWLWLPLDTMIEQAAKGHLAQSMPSSVGVLVLVGVALVAIGGTRVARFYGASAIVLWLLASRDVVWLFRLDHLSEGFTHLQYQRFIIAAKPGLFLMAGAAIAIPIRAGQRALTTLRRPHGPVLAALAWLGTAAAAGWVLVDQVETAKKHHVGELQLVRSPRLPQLGSDYAELLRWLESRWNEREAFWRTTVRDSRNIHWFMDAPVHTDGAPIYKQGFTPGNNFVHKPESGSSELLDRLGVRYEIRRGRGGAGRPSHVASFGQIQVFERPSWKDYSPAWIEGTGRVELLESDLDGGPIRVRVSDAEPDSTLVFGIGGFPRWRLEHEGDPVEWFETPVVGDGPDATLAERRLGALRGGKARGDDGTEPTLIATPARDGVYTLEYRRWTWLDVVAVLISLLALAVCAALLSPAERYPRPERILASVRHRLGYVGHPLVLAAVVVAAVIVGWTRHRAGVEQESDRAFGWVQRGRAADRREVTPGFLKTDMLIRPALKVHSRRGETARLHLEGIEIESTLEGWFALDDDDAQLQRRGRHRIEVRVRPRGGSWQTLESFVMPHRPGQRPLEVATGELSGQVGDLEVLVHSEGERPPSLGFDLALTEVGAP